MEGILQMYPRQRAILPCDSHHCDVMRVASRGQSAKMIAVQVVAGLQCCEIITDDPGGHLEERARSQVATTAQNTAAFETLAGLCLNKLPLLQSIHVCSAKESQQGAV